MLFCLAGSVGKGDVLLWQVNDTATVDGTPIINWIASSPYVEDDDHWVAARVKISDGNGRVLDIRSPEYTDPSTGEYHPAGYESGEWGMWLTDGEQGWGTGAGVQSPTGHKTWYTTTDGPDAIIENPDAIEALFTMQLGYNSYDASINDYVWETVAESYPEVTYKYLRDNYMYGVSTIDPYSMNSWTPTEFHTIPEPTTFLLLLLGFGILALRRNNGNR